MSAHFWSLEKKSAKILAKKINFRPFSRKNLGDFFLMTENERTFTISGQKRAVEFFKSLFRTFSCKIKRVSRGGIWILKHQPRRKFSSICWGFLRKNPKTPPQKISGYTSVQNSIQIRIIFYQIQESSLSRGVWPPMLSLYKLISEHHHKKKFNWKYLFLHPP